MADQYTLEPNDLEESIDPRELDMQAQIQEVVHSFEGDVVNVKCKLYKIEKGRRRWLFDAMPVELGDIQNNLKNEYGPGLYENHVYINGKLDQRLKLDIGETLADKFPGRQVKEETGLNSSDILNLVREMNTNQAEQNRLMMERMENTVKAAIPHQSEQLAIDPVKLQTSMLAMMVQMKDLLSGNTQPQQDPIDTVSRLLEMTSNLQALSGESGTVPAMASLAKEFLPRLMEMATLQASKPAPNPAAAMTPDQITHMANAHTAAVTAQGQPQGQPQAQPQPGDKAEMLNKFMVNKALVFLLQSAQRDFSPVTYAELLIDQAQIHGMEQEVINYMLAEDTLTTLYGINPAVGQYKAWFEHLIEAVREMVSEVPPEEDGQANNEPDLTNGQVHAINPMNASTTADQKPTVADSRRSDGNADNPTHNVESG